MAYLNVVSNVTVTDIDQNTIEVNYLCDKTLSDVKLSMDNGSSYRNNISMTSTSAKFDITGMSNNTYNCLLKGYYEEGSTSTQGGITVNQSSYTVAQGKDLSISVTMSGLPDYPVFELRRNGEYLCSAYKNNDTTIVAYTSSLSVDTFSNVTIVAKEYKSDTGYVDIAISNPITITITGSSSGGGGSSGGGSGSPSTVNFLDYMYPMPQPHEAIPNGAPYDWQHQSRWENQTKPAGWKAFGGWAQVYRVEGTPFSQNTGVELKDYQVYGWKNGQWHLVSKVPAPSGYFYAEDFQDDAHTTFAGKMLYYEASVAIRLTEDMTVNTSTGTKNVCYHPFTTHLDYDADFEYVFTCVSMRKIKWDEHGVDDRDSARYCASCGGDWWREKGLTWAPDWSNNKGIAQPKITEVTNDWKVFAMTTVPQDWKNGFPV